MTIWQNPREFMSNKQDNNEEENQFIIKGPNGEFDVSTAEGRAQAEGFMMGLSQAQGRLANENDVLKRSSGRKYDLSGASSDVQEASKAAKKLREGGASDEDVDNFWAEYVKQSQSAALKGNQFDVLWVDYMSQRPELKNTMTEVDIDIYKDHIDRKYRSRLQDETDQFQFLDQIFEAKLRKAQPDVADLEEPVPYVAGGSKVATPRAASTEPKEEKTNEAGVTESNLQLLRDSFKLD